MGLCCTPHRRVLVGLRTHLTNRDVLLLGSPRDVVSCSLLHQVHKIIVVINFGCTVIFAMAWSIALVNLDQLAFFRLKRLLKGQCVAVTGDLMVIVLGRRCVRGVVSCTPLWYIEAIQVLTNATSGLYPLSSSTVKRLG